MKQCIVVISCIAALAMTLSARANEAVNELSRIRDNLRAKLETRLGSDVAADQPRDWLLTVDQGAKKPALTMTLMQRGDHWSVANVSGLGSNQELDSAVFSNVRRNDTRLTGQLKLAWRSGSANDQEAASDAEISRLVYELDLAVKPVDKRLVLRFHRFQGGQDWVLVYRRDGDQWVYEKPLQAPRGFEGPDPNAPVAYKTEAGPLKAGMDGAFRLEIRLPYVGKEESVRTTYANGREPVVTVQGRMIETAIDSTWQLKSQGGKHLLGTGQDLFTGSMLEAEIDGRCKITGTDTEAVGVIRGMVVGASKTTAILDVIAPDAGGDDLARAAALYGQIRALDMAIALYPMSLGEIIRRVPTPEPVTIAGNDTGRSEYLNGLLAMARQTLRDGKPSSKPLKGAVRPDTARFGPFFGHDALPTRNNLDAVNPAGSQQWRAVGDWKMTGPFAVAEQDAELFYPDVLPVTVVSFKRKRMVDNPTEGTISLVEDTVPWYDSGMDGATVFAPSVPHASSGGERYFAWYATSELTSATEQTVWLAVAVEGQAMLWVNDALVWNSGASHDSVWPSVFQAPLRQGANRLTIRVASNRASNAHFDQVSWFEGYKARELGRMPSTTFALHVATAGQPGGASAATSSSVKSLSAAELPLSYRQDGSGVFPDAKPPRAWDLAKGINIGWSTQVPRGKGDMVLRDGKLHLCAEPNILVCLDAATGKELWRQTTPYPESDNQKKNKANITSTAALSPVVTADHVYVHYGVGVVACYGRDGSEKWVTPTGAAWDHPNMGSPVIVDGRFIVQTHLPGEPDGQFGLMAFDATTGKQLWTARGVTRRVLTSHDRPSGFGNGIAVMRLVNGATAKSVVITGDGAIVDAADGALLHRDVYIKEAGRAAPYVVADTIYNCTVMGEEAVQLWLDDSGKIGARTLWANPPSYGRGQVKTVTHWGPYHWMKGPLVHGDLLYVWRIDKAHVPQHWPVPWGQLDVHHRHTGERLARYRGVTVEATDPTIAPTLAGNLLFLGDGGDPVGGFHGDEKFGKFGVVELLPVTVDPQQSLFVRSPVYNGVWGLAVMTGRSRTEKLRASPVFDGDRMYLRHFGEVLCIAESSPEGKRFADETVANVTLQEVLGPRPEGRAKTAIAPADTFAASDKIPVARLEPGVPSRRWVYAGPFAGGPMPSAPATLMGVLAEGQTAEVDGKPATLTRVDEKFTNVKGGIDVYASTGFQKKSVVYFHTVLESMSRQTLLLNQQPEWLAMWINGKEVKPGVAIDFDVGFYPMLVRVQIGEMPPFIKSLVMTPSFSQVNAMEESAVSWAKRAATLRPRLESIIKSLPGTEQAREAQARLDQMNRAPAP
jgi:outer membrane protein assembly factor BamB